MGVSPNPEEKAMIVKLTENFLLPYGSFKRYGKVKGNISKVILAFYSLMGVS